MEQLVETIAPVFKHEPSIIRWTALRGAITDLYIQLFDESSASHVVMDAEAAMAYRRSDSGPQLIAPWRDKLSVAQQEAATGIAATAMGCAADYPRYSKMNVQDVIADPWLSLYNDAVALDCIAWCVVVLSRLGTLSDTMQQVPQPDALTVAGWYPEPLFNKGERYWNGQDWTSRCRIVSGRDRVETQIPLT